MSAIIVARGAIPTPTSPGGMVFQFPNQKTAGVRVPAGTGGTTVVPNGLIAGGTIVTAPSLSTYAGPSTITSNLSGFHITSQILIGANNLTISDCYFTVGGTCLNTAGFTGTTVQYCEFAGETPPGLGNNVAGDIDIIIPTDATFNHCYVHGASKFFYIDAGQQNVTIQNCFCEYQDSNTAHIDGIFVDPTTPSGVVSGITITGNTIATEVPAPHAAPVAGPIFLKIDGAGGSISNVSVTKNLLLGGGFTFDNQLTFSTLTFSDNIFGLGTVSYSPTNGANVWSNNIDSLTGQVVSPTNTLSANPNCVITSFTPSSSIPASAGDAIMTSALLAQQIATSATATLKGCTAGANIVDIYMDGSASPLGNTTAASSGIWTFTTTQTGTHSFVAKDRTTAISSPAFYVQFP